MFWPSRPDSGYSVDNLPPLPPAPFSGEYSAGVAHLHWDPNREPDLAGYRLYRGTTARFIPGPSDLLAAQPDTGYVYSTVQPYYYKLSAVDIHGNESGFSLLLPAGTLDTPGARLPTALSFSPPTPNPARGGTQFHFALPRNGHVSMLLFDQQGRRVRELLNQSVAAGEHTISWDGREDGGQPAPSGLYFVRLEAEGRTITQRLATLR